MVEVILAWRKARAGQASSARLSARTKRRARPKAPQLQGRPGAFVCGRRSRREAGPGGPAIAPPPSPQDKIILAMTTPIFWTASKTARSPKFKLTPTLVPPAGPWQVRMRRGWWLSAVGGTPAPHAFPSQDQKRALCWPAERAPPSLESRLRRASRPYSLLFSTRAFQAVSALAMLPGMSCCHCCWMSLL
jgi:hypothetical protein